MTIDEALGDLSIQLEVKRRVGAIHQANAILLGIEALEEIKRLRTRRVINFDNELPSETKD